MATSHWPCCAPRIFCDRICIDNTGSGRRGLWLGGPGLSGGRPLGRSWRRPPVGFRKNSAYDSWSIVNVKCRKYGFNVPSSLLKPPFHQIPTSPASPLLCPSSSLYSLHSFLIYSSLAGHLKILWVNYP